MNITSPADQEHWLEVRIAKAEFQSAEDAVRQVIAERMIIDDPDLAWARPPVDDARAAVARGETSTLEEAVADIDEVLRSLIVADPARESYPRDERLGRRHQSQSTGIDVAKSATNTYIR